jgi:hypothetical protein
MNGSSDDPHIPNDGSTVPLSNVDFYYGELNPFTSGCQLLPGRSFTDTR